MKYLVTGSAGFIGTNLVEYLLDQGEFVLGVDYDTCDLCDSVFVPPNAEDIDIIVHLAAETNVRESIEKPYKTFLRNCQSTLNVLMMAKDFNAKLIFASSCGAPNSMSPYAASKLAGEAICIAYKNSYDLDVDILRFSNVYGPHSLHKNSVIAKFIKNILDGEILEVFGNGNQQRDFVHVEDICRAIHSGQFTGLRSIGSGFMTPIKDLVKILDCRGVTYSPRIPGEITFPDSCERIPDAKGLLSGLNETFKWFEKNYK